jgi:tetratricopeptide (TPR) repeat protein
MEDLAGGCLPLEAVQDFVSGTLPAGEADRVEEHIDGCAACRELIGAVARAAARSRVGSGAGAGEDRPDSLESDPTVFDLAAPARAASAERFAGHPPAGTRIGRYVVERPIGAGGMGTVSLADDPELKRKVCIKLVRPELLAAGDPQATRARLAREAQAMAQISHPNVVSVFDIGTYGDQVFVAMECVEGTDLARWLAMDRRRPGEVLDVFCAAGRGLAAAHRAGLIHRDFKPQNVLLGTDGTVKVTDFGLARTGPARDSDGVDLRAGEDGQERRPGQERGRDTRDPVTPLGPPLTRRGALVGTPAYMAPEQLDGETVDARSDQFAFAVALYEALFGERPFPGSTAAEIHRAASEGRLRPMPRRAGVPRRVRAAILRALSPRPEQRLATMEALLAALTPRRWRRAALAAAAALVAGGVLATVADIGGAEEVALCDRGAGLMAAVWNDGSRQRMRAGLAATGVAPAADPTSLLVRQIDGYASAWAAAHREACVATRVRGDQDEEMLALRMACLEGRRAELAATLQILEQPGARLDQGAYELPARLGPIADCADARMLSAPVALPRDPAQRAQIAEVRARLARAEAFLDAERPDPARAAAGPAVETASRIGWAPLLAEATLTAARVDLGLVRFENADKGFRAAATIAEQAGHDRVRVEAYLGLMQTQRERGQLDDALRWADFARAVIERTGSRRLCDLTRELVKVQRKKGDNLGAIAESRRAAELCTRERGARSREMGDVHLELARLYGRTGAPDKAMAEDEQASAIGRALGGEDDPLSLLALMGIASTRRMQGRAAEALPLMERSLAGIRRVYGDDHINTAAAYMALGLTQATLGQAEPALANLERALEMMRRHMGPSDQSVAQILSAMGQALIFARRPDQAIPRLQESIEIAARRGETPDTIDSRVLLGKLLTAREDHAGAIAQYERALAGAELIFAPNSPKLAMALTGLGAGHRANGQPERALPLLERALGIVQSDNASSNDSARTKLELARALWNARADRDRALRLAGEALVEARSMNNAVLAGQAERWLASARAILERPGGTRARTRAKKKPRRR